MSGRNEPPWAINITDVKNDMTAGQGRPQWILSTYGPGRSPPASLLEDNEYSFEELRLRFYELASTGNEAQANQEAGVLWTKAEDCMRAIAQNADDVIKYMEDADKKHPNRYDFCQTDGTKTREELAKASESQTSFGGGFGQAAFGQPATSGFGQSGFGQPSQPIQSANPFAQPSAANAFGKPAFDQPAATTGFGQGGFGQPPQPPQSTNPFAQPSAANTFSKQAFGQPAAAAGFDQGGFGQPSQPANGGFGQSMHSAIGFGQPSSQPGQSANPFAQPAAGGFGQPSQSAAAFGQPSQPNNTAFGKPAAPEGFGQNGFGQPGQPAATGFGAPTAPAVGGFGAPLQPAVSGFGAGTGFGAKPPDASPFGQPAAPISLGGFAKPSALAVSTGLGQHSNLPAATAFGTAPAPSASLATTPNAQSGQSLNSLTSQPAVSLHYTETLPNRTASTRAGMRPGTKDVISYAGRRVQYVNDAPCYERPDGKGLERIWFPEFGNGADVTTLNAPEKKVDLEGKAEDYTDAVKQSYVHLFTKGGFGDAGMPSVPPMREWCAFDF